MNKTEKPMYELVKMDSEQMTWQIHFNSESNGKVWLDVSDTDYLDSPAIHITFDNDNYDQAIGTAAMKETIKYAYCNLPSEFLYSRFTLTDQPAEKLLTSLGFENDGKPYSDDNNIEWQNVRLVL